MKSNKTKISELEKYTWGFGIEHEMHLFHAPLYKKNINIKDFIVFDSEKVVKNLLEESNNFKTKLNYDDYNFLKNIPYEKSGRMCNEQWVIEMVPCKMPEFITNNPFCSIPKNRNILIMTQEIRNDKENFYKLMELNENSKKLIDKYGKLSEYPFGMTRYLKYPVATILDKYIFKKDFVVPEYNGSYHMTLTLPHKESITTKQFIKIHQNFCNQLQWLEPLMLTAYFTGDEYAPGNLKQYTRGSFRVMIIGWGNFAGTDVRLLSKGIGRYAKTKTFWRKGLKFEDSDKLKPCFKPSPMAKKEGAITSLSSDFRTFGSTDPLRPSHRESGIGMTKPNGIEFRIFDHFHDKYLDHLSVLMTLVAENSRIKQTKGYVYENKIWIKEMHNIMKNGYKSKLSKKYIDLLREKLGLKININSIIATDIFKEIYSELWKKNINGNWTKILFCLPNKTYLQNLKLKTVNNFPDINKKGWQFAFITKLNQEKDLLDAFNNLSKILNKLKKVKFSDFKSIVIKLFNKNWKDDIEDIAYFYESNGFIHFDNNSNGTIKCIYINKIIPIFNNFNEYICNMFDDKIL
jgi:hypothetical protein